MAQSTYERGLQAVEYPISLAEMADAIINAERYERAQARAMETRRMGKKQGKASPGGELGQTYDQRCD